VKALYGLIDVDAGASSERIRNAYLRRMERHLGNGKTTLDPTALRRLTAVYQAFSDSERRLRYDETRPGDECPECGEELPMLATAAEAHLLSHYEIQSDACLQCGRLPTRRFELRSSQGRVFWSNVETFDGQLCTWCARGVFRDFQARNLVQGPLGFSSFFAAAGFLIANSFRMRKGISGLAAPEPAQPTLDRRLAGDSLISRPTVWIAVLGLAAVVTLVGVVLTT
jgi:hypothetical protein